MDDSISRQGVLEMLDAFHTAHPLDSDRYLIAKLKQQIKDFPSFEDYNFEDFSPVKPTEKQIKYAKYLAGRMCVDLPKEFTKKAYSDFISELKPAVKHEDDTMNEPNEWQLRY